MADRKRAVSSVRDLVSTVLDAVDAATTEDSGAAGSDVIQIDAKMPRVEVNIRSDLKYSSMPPSAEALEKWQAGVRAASKTADVNVIEMFDVIGYDYWTGGGITTDSVAQQLKSFDGEDCEVHINSPGGDMFEGIGIYNLLAQYPGKVTVKVFAVAASAASTIAMAGDEIQIGQGSFIMIHNCWVMAMGNQFDFREIADYLAPFDSGLTDIYIARTDEKRDQIASWMKAEKWFSTQEAIDNGFADKAIDAKDLTEDKDATAKAAAVIPVRKMESLLCKQGMTRTAARAFIKSLKDGKQDAAVTAGTQDAAGNTTQDAGDDWIKSAQAVIQKLKE